MQAGLHRDRRQRDRQRSVRHGRRAGGAQGHADAQPGAAQAARPARKQADRGATCARRWRPCPGMRSTVGFGGAGEKLHLVLAGDDGRSAADDAARRGRARPADAARPRQRHLHRQRCRPELIIRPTPARAADLGVTAAAIAETLRVATAGDYDQSLAKLNLPQRQVPIVVRLPERRAHDLDAAPSAAVPGAQRPGAARQRRRPWRSSRAPRRSTATTAAATSLRDRAQRPAARRRPDQVRRAAEPASTCRRPCGAAELGDAEGMKELFESFGLAMLIGVLCIYTVLVLLFHDFLQPVTILAALPLSLGGAFAGAAADRQGLLDAVADRPAHADGHRHQELDPAGRVRDRRAPRPRHEPHRRTARRLPQARAADRDDDDRDGRRHAADRAGPRASIRASARRWRSR